MKPSRVIRRAPTMVRSAVRDLRHGALLGGTTRTRFAHLGAFHSANSPYADLDRVFAGVAVAPGDLIVDVGCGKGRSLNWFLDRYPGNDIVGIELDPDIAAATAKRLRREQRVTILCGDAVDRLPPEGRIFYLFNPFDEAAVARFAAALLARPGPATIVYYNDKHLEPFHEDGRFTISGIDEPRLDHRSSIITMT